MNHTHNAFFGEVLRQFRKRKGLSQQRLASLIGVHRDSMSSWERGEYFPETPTMLHELARVLALDAEEKRLLFESLYGTASMLPVYNLPEHNPYFTGREQMLHQIHRHLTQTSSVAPVAPAQPLALSGLAGMGKTQVALAYAYRFRAHYHDIFWVQAETRETMIASYLVFAEQLRLPEREQQAPRQVIEAVTRWFRNHKGWLLILDNVEDMNLLHLCLPVPRQGTILLTTRQAVMAPFAHTLTLDVMTEAEGMLLLLRRAGMVAHEEPLDRVTADQQEEARVIVRAVGGLPLALDQAGTYLAETHCCLADYLALFQRQAALLLDRRGQAVDHVQSVSSTFSLCFEQVEQASPTAAALLRLCLFLVPDAIPEEMLLGAGSSDDSLLPPLPDDPVRFDDALVLLHRYSLLQRNPESKTLTIHRLVQMVLRERIDAHEQRLWAEQAVLVINSSFPTIGGQGHLWSSTPRCFSHAQACVALIEAWHIRSLEAARLLTQLGAYLVERGDYEQAFLLLKKALEMRMTLLGSQHPDVVETLNDLAIIAHYQHHDDQAETLHRQALAILTTIYGPEHPDVAQCLQNIATVCHYQGKYTETEALFQQALHMRKMLHGAAHHEVATCCNDFARLVGFQGNYGEAECLYQQALAIYEHPSIPKNEVLNHARTLVNLASLILEQGRVEQAESLCTQGLTLFEEALGTDHADTALAMNMLGQVLLAQGNVEQAQSAFERVLCIWERELAPQHPRLVQTRAYLTALESVRGKTKK